ncbi:MAG: sigma-54 dependent transcriptional regulator [Candidatus Poribacteria bacterium]|nr:sigma-54 dependent transcriptional regulator [Candidatus Poribacteria bacterium]
MPENPERPKKAIILIVDDNPANRDLLRQTLEPENYGIRLAPNGTVAIQLVGLEAPDLILLDVIMPEIDGFETCIRLKANPDMASIPVIFITARHESESVVKGFQVGGVDYITKPFSKEEVLARVETHLKIDRMAKDLLHKNTALSQANEALTQAYEKLKQEITRREQAEDALQIAAEERSIISEQEAARWGIAGFVGTSQTIKKILNEVRQLQEVGTTSILITGESGTGKELIARAIHFGGTRADGRFVPVNCSTIPSELAESVLFGHVKGAFTGANTDRLGYFELADGGTLFLDEIGDMPLELQVKLLRVLEDGCIMPIGATGEKRVDVRILAATNADLQRKIAEGTFREDLYYRIARFPVAVPPLRERREDIPLLVEHFLNMFAHEMSLSSERGGGEASKRGNTSHAPSLSPEAMEVLMNYPFPGNIRELKNIIEGALILSGRREIRPEHLHLIEDRGEVTQPSLSTTDTTETSIENQPPQKRPSDREKLEVLVVKRAQVRSSSKKTGIQTAPAHETDEEKIVAYVREHGSINNAECRTLLNIDRQRANYLLRKLHRYGLLAPEGTRRWLRYHLPS